MAGHQAKRVSTQQLAAGNGIKSDDLHGLVGYLMKRAYMQIRADFRTSLSPFDLTQRTFSVLSCVVENDGSSQSDIARALGIERSGIVLIVDELEGRGFLERARVEGDRRAYALSSTAEGKTYYRRALAAVREHETRMLAQLNEGERDTLRVMLESLCSVPDLED